MAKRRFAVLGAAAAIHAGLWWWAIQLEGVWRQVPGIDQASDLRIAWLMWRALSSVDLLGLAHVTVYGSPVHTPLVPLVSSGLMALFGPSRQAAESLLPVATVVWLFAVYATLVRLVRPSLALQATLLSSAFPVFLIYSKTYLFEHPLSAVFALACWSLLATDGFLETGASITFGVLAGLTALTRGGAGIFLVGPAVVVLASAAQKGQWSVRLRNVGLAMWVAVGLASIWYLPNWQQFTDYLYRSTYGEEAALRAGIGGSFTWNNALYYTTSLIAQGPGMPMLAVATIAWISRSRHGTSSHEPANYLALGLTLAFGIDFLLLLVAAQHEAARYFQPLMPLLALAVVAVLEGVRPALLRRVLSSLVVLLALHHVLSLSLPSIPGPRAPDVHGVQLWDHVPYFQRLVDYSRLRTPTDDLHISDTIDRLEGLALPTHAIVGSLGTAHAFYQPNTLQLEATRRGREWVFMWSSFVEPADLGHAPRALPAAPVDVMLVRTGGPSRLDLTNLTRALPDVLDPRAGSFDQTGPPLLLGDGSTVMILKRRRTS